MTHRVNYFKHDKKPKWILCDGCKKPNSNRDRHCKHCGTKLVAPPKFNNKGRNYNGRFYDSTAEAAYAEKLDWRMHVGDIIEVIPQYKIRLEVNGMHICDYKIDFRIQLADKTYEYHEYKGVETREWQLKWRLCEALYPDWVFVLVK